MLKIRKMKKLSLLLITLFLMSCQQEKIGYVDNVKVMEGYQKKKDVEAMFQLKSDVFTKKRDSISQAFQLEAQELQNKSKGMSQEKALQIIDDATGTQLCPDCVGLFFKWLTQKET